MQQFKNNIKNLLTKIENLSILANMHLSQNSEDDNSQLVSDIYTDRQFLMDELLMMKNNERFQSFIIESGKEWDKIIKNINLIEEKNIFLLNAKAQEIGIKLKNLKKQSSLLVYKQGF